MLGLANVLSSSSTPESKYSLDFDGTDDYVDFNNVLNLSDADFTISAWVKLAEATSSNIISKFYDSNNRWFIRTNSSDKVQCYGKAGTEVFDIESAVVSENEWIHIVHTNDRSDGTAGAKVYINGSLSGSAGASATTDLDNNGRLYIGRQDGVYATLNTKITDVAIWNAVLDANNVGAIYNGGKPTNLTLDSGNYNNSSALRAYYKMGNGLFDDKASGAIHDQHDPGFGAELVDNGDFSQSLAESDWAVANGTTKWSISGGKATGSGDDSAKYIQQDVGVVNNKTYKLSYEVVESSLTSTGETNLFLLSTFSAFGSTPLEYSVGTHVKYLVAKSDGADDVPDLKIAISSNANGGTISIDNVSLKQVNGFPGLTSNMDVDDFTSDTP